MTTWSSSCKATTAGKWKPPSNASAPRLANNPSFSTGYFTNVTCAACAIVRLLYLPAAQIAQIQGNLGDMKLLLEASFLDSWKKLSLGSLLDEAASHRVPALEPGGTLRQGDETFFTQLNSISRAAARMIDDPDVYANPWQSILPPSPEQRDMLAEPQYFFSGDGTLAFLLVRPLKEAGSFTARQAKRRAQLREIVAVAKPEFSGLQFGLHRFAGP